MKPKYWVPALERAHAVLTCIAANPAQLRLTELCAATEINKSTMYSLLSTLESLQWITKDKGDTYSLGPAVAYMSNVYFSNIDIVQLFMQHAEEAVAAVGETVQLARLEGEHIVYLAKREAPAPVRLLSEPGRRIPAYATALGKVLLAAKSDEEIKRMYEDAAFIPLTNKTIKDGYELLIHLRAIRSSGYAVDEEEVAAGFCCMAAPIRDTEGKAVAAVSFSIPVGQWAEKKERAREAIERLGLKLSGMNA